MKTTNLRVIAAVAGGGVPGAESSMLKIRGTEIRQEISSLTRARWAVRAALRAEALRRRLRGRTSDPTRRRSAASQYFNYRKLSIFGGSNEIQKNIISKMILGLDHELRTRRRPPHAGGHPEPLHRRAVPVRDARQDRQVGARLQPRIVGPGSPSSARSARCFAKRTADTAAPPWTIAVVFEALGRGLVVEPFLASAVLAGGAIAASGNDAQKAAHRGDHRRQQDRRVRARRAGFALRAVSRGHARRRAGRLGARRRRRPWCSTPSSAERSSFPRAPRRRRRRGRHLAVPGAGDARGLTLRGYPLIDGGRAAEVTLRAVELPATPARRRGQGFATIEKVVGAGVLALCAEALGAMEAAKDATLEYLRTRKQFGVSSAASRRCSTAWPTCCSRSSRRAPR
jgi:alkylation response protein AidB-like acyl-CoA dehydrogenase